MAQYADTIDLSSLNLPPGGGTRFDAIVRMAPIELGGQRYAVGPGNVEARVDVSRTTSGWSFRLRFEAALTGPCMRCLADAAPVIAVEAREVDQPGGGEELRSPYMREGELELSDWAHDALVLALPTRLLCRPDCRGLCPVCGQNLNDADPDEHRHERAPDPRWAKLSELKLD
jgi:DUF177 domain-containing protein